MPAQRRRAERAPTVDELAAAMEALTPRDNGLLKYAGWLVASVILGLVFWVGTSVSNLSTTVTRISTNVDQVQSSISDLRTGQSNASKTMADLQSGQARNEARADAIEADLKRTKDRVRQLEGITPLNND